MQFFAHWCNLYRSLLLRSSAACCSTPFYLVPLSIPASCCLYPNFETCCCHKIQNEIILILLWINWFVKNNLFFFLNELLTSFGFYILTPLKCCRSHTVTCARTWTTKQTACCVQFVCAALVCFTAIFHIKSYHHVRINIKRLCCTQSAGGAGFTYVQVAQGTESRVLHFLKSPEIVFLSDAFSFWHSLSLSLVYV